MAVRMSSSVSLLHGAMICSGGWWVLTTPCTKRGIPKTTSQPYKAPKHPVPGGVQRVQATHKHGVENVPNAGAPRQLASGHPFGAPLYRLGEARGVGVEQLEQQRAPVYST